MSGAADMPDTPEEEEPSRRDNGDAIPPEGANEQDHDGPATYRDKTFMEHFEDATNEHETLGRLLAQ